METVMAPDHDYCVVPQTGARASNFAEENEALHRQIRELQQQLELLNLRQHFGIQRLSASDEDVRFYTRFASYRCFMAFWRLIEPAVTHKMIRITSVKTAYIQPLLTRDVACQTDHLETHTVGTQLSLKTLPPHFTSEEDCDAFGDRSTQHGATSESLGVDAPGSTHMSSHSGELKILSIYGKGEGPLAVDGHETLFTASEPEALSSLSVDHSVAKSLNCSVAKNMNCSVAKSLNCSVRLVRLEELTGHQGGRKGRPGVLCGNNANMIVHMRTQPDERPYGCDRCIKRFRQKKGLKIHMMIHSGEKPYKCDQCTICFRHKGHQTVHMRTHTGEKPYKCDQCAKRFSRKGALNIHMRSHSGEKPYRCDQCTKCFRHKGQLTVHMRTHSGEKPYRCDQCTKRFSYSKSLKSHMRAHPREKPHSCD